MAVSDWSAVADENTTVGGINIAEGCPPGNLNDAIREMMAEIKTKDEEGPSAHHVTHEPGGSDQITVFGGNVAEKFQSLGSISGTKSIDLTAGNIVIATIGGSTTFSFSGVVAGMANTVMLKLTNAGSAAITWPSGVLWPGGQAPTLTAAGLDVIVMETDDNGVSWVAVPNIDVKGAA